MFYRCSSRGLVDFVGIFGYSCLKNPFSLLLVGNAVAIAPAAAANDDDPGERSPRSRESQRDNVTTEMAREDFQATKKFTSPC